MKVRKHRTESERELANDQYFGYADTQAHDFTSGKPRANRPRTGPVQFRTGGEPVRCRCGERPMNRRTVGFEPHHEDHVEAVQERTDADTFSEAVRTLVEEHEDLRDRVDHAEARAEELRRQVQAERERQEQVGELVEYVETEKSMQERKAEAGIVTRAKWWAFGMDREK